MARPLELILARQWANLLAVPVLLFDEAGCLVFFNGPAESLLGRSYSETGTMGRAEWTSAFHMEREDGSQLAATENPLYLGAQEPAQTRLRIRGMDGVSRKVAVSAFPIIGSARTSLGFMALVHSVR